MKIKSTCTLENTLSICKCQGHGVIEALTQVLEHTLNKTLTINPGWAILPKLENNSGKFMAFNDRH